MLPIFSMQDFDPSMTMVGRGQFGEVYGTHWGKIKVVHKICLFRRNQDVFCNEINVLRTLSHPGIPRLYGILNDPLTLVMEWKPGVNLADYISNPNPYKAGIRTIRKIAISIANIFQFLHHKRIIYRDLKPDNLLFEPKTEQIHLVDFGLAIQLKTPDHLLRTGIVGTRGYIAPEILNKKMYSFPVDIYSYGKTIYCLFIFPYFERHGTIPSNKQIDFFFWDIIQKCCKPHPKDRPDIDNLLKLLNGEEESIIISGAKKSFWQKLCCCFPFYR